MNPIEFRNDDYFTKEEAAVYLKISVTTLNRSILNAHITPYKVGKRMLIKKQDLLDYLEGGGKNA